jgi:hypothetical protein
MAGKYNHTFDDLGQPSETVGDITFDAGDPAVGQDLTGATVVNEAPGNPNKGAADQFDDLPSNRKEPEVDPIDDAIILEGEGDEGGDDQGDEQPQRGAKRSSFQERLDRETQLRRETEERARRIEADNAELRARFDLQDRRQEWDRADATADSEINTLREQRRAAIEAGETGKVDELDDKLMDLKVAKRDRANQRAAAEAAVKKAKEEPGVVKPTNNPKAQAWIDAHPAYKDDPLFRSAAQAADRLLYNAGMNANSDDYFREMSRIMAQTPGGAFRDKLDQRYLRGPRGGKPPVRGGGSDGVRSGANGIVREGSKTKVVITREERNMMASMGLDVTNPAVLREFARNKMADARRDREQ